MPDYEWKSAYSTPGPGAAEEEIAVIEVRLGIRFPSALREGFKTAESPSIFKAGKRCAWGVTGPQAAGGRYLGFMQYLEPLDRMEDETRFIAEYVDDLYERPFLDVIPFAQLPAGGWTCLNYQPDPTRANPEVWEANMETNRTFETFFHKIADSFDDFIDMLHSNDELAAMGFKV